MFKQLEKITRRSKPFEFYTTPFLWNDEYISGQMLEMHLNPDIEAASRDHKFINRSVKWIIENFDISSNSAICDFGCGPGLYTHQFAKTGAKVTGIDLSKKSIDYAINTMKKDNLDINYHNQNYLEFIPTEKYDLITMIYCDFCVLSPKQTERLFEIFRKALNPNGKLLLDVFSNSWFNKQIENLSFEVSDKDGFWSNEKYYVFKNTIKYEKERIYLDKYTLIQDGNENNIFNWLKCYEKEELIKLFANNGFVVESFHSNVAGDDYTPDSDTFAVTAHLID